MSGTGKERYWLEIRQREDLRKKRATEAMVNLQKEPFKTLRALLPHALRTVGTRHFFTKALAKALEEGNEQSAAWVLMMAPKYLPDACEALEQ